MPPQTKLANLKFVLLGSGNVASNLGLELIARGFQVTQVYSRDVTHAKRLAQKLKAKYTGDLRQLNTAADIYILAVKDDALELLAKNLRIPGKLVLHTSGSVSLQILHAISKRCGVFYPLMTFTRHRKPSWSEIPLCLETEDPKDALLLRKIAGCISRKVLMINSRQREHLHLAAVFANNFSNHLYSISAGLLQKEKLPFTLLAPLIRETAEKAILLGPAIAQTGPARRGDLKILKKHLKQLASDPSYKQVYAALSKSIASA
jgi:predicted short-subunit dehydrogenase-like oxidoreductase (DUF2520 family)